LLDRFKCNKNYFYITLRPTIKHFMTLLQYLISQTVNCTDNAIIHVREFSVQTLCLIIRRNWGFSLHKVTMPSHALQSLCRLHRLFTEFFLLILYSHNCKFFVRKHLKGQIIKILIEYNFLHRLAQIQEKGIQDRIYKQFAVLKEPEEQPSAIDVSMVTVAPIMAVLAAGYLVGIFVLLIERCAHGNKLKCWPRGSVRRWGKIKY